ncbi:hypothetical protein ACFLWW_02370, partial [Chloroflexota bacterium]
VKAEVEPTPEPAVKAEVEPTPEPAVKAKAAPKTKPAVKAEVEPKIGSVVRGAKAKTKWRPRVNKAASKRAKRKKRF